ncbi:MAG: hypothetical protein ACM3IJ_05355 [Candidatus Levyibacteriota bacterium]
MGFIQFLKRNPRVVLFILVFGFALYATILFLTLGQRGYDNDLVVLSGEFLKKNIAIPPPHIPIRDVSNYYNNFYIYFGPLSSMLLVPFVLIFGIRFPQVSLGIFSLLASFFASYKISRNFKFSPVDSLWLATFVVFSTVLYSSSVINVTAYQVEVLGVPFVLLSLWAYFSKKHPFFMGLFLGIAILTRFTLVLGLVFFFIEFLRKRLSFKHGVILFLPVLCALILLGAYNQRRFHSFLETGYNYNISKSDYPISENFKYGDIKALHIPANLYSFLFMAPEPLRVKDNQGLILRFPYLKANPWGIAIWFTSPLFLLLVLHFKKGKYTISSGLAALALSGPVFLWYSIGFAQFGYRYALDFLPFLFILLLPCLFPKLSKTAIMLIILGVLFNCIYTDSMWEIYPVFWIYP